MRRFVHKWKGCAGSVDEMASSSPAAAAAPAGASFSLLSAPAAKPAKKKRAASRKPRPSVAFMDRELKAVTSKANVTFAGRWTPEVWLSGAASFSGRRDIQVLRHLSVQFFHYIRNTLNMKGEQEVQAMLVNDRIVIAANLDDSINALFKALRQDDTGGPPSNAVQNLLQSVQNPDDKRAEGAAKKLGGLFSGTRSLSNIPTAMNVLGNDNERLLQRLDYSNAADCAAKIVGAAHHGRLIFVNAGGDSIHAEQKLLLALLRSGTSKSTVATIYGKKRPCAGCYLTLLFAEERLGLKIEFNRHPGGFWGPALKGFRALFDQAKGHMQSNSPGDVCTWLHDQVAALVTHQTQYLGADEKRSMLQDSKAQFVALGKVDPRHTGYDSPSDSDPDDDDGDDDDGDDDELAGSAMEDDGPMEDDGALSAAGSGNPFSLLPSPPAVPKTPAPAAAAAASSFAAVAAHPAAPFSVVHLKSDSKASDGKSIVAPAPDLSAVPSPALKGALAAKNFVRGAASSQGLNCFLHSFLQLFHNMPDDPNYTLIGEVLRIRRNWNVIGAAVKGQDLNLENAFTREEVHQLANFHRCLILIWGFNSATNQLYEVCRLGGMGGMVGQPREINILWYGPHFEPLRKRA
ncbi:hypothetical protein HPP05_09835 [Corallococcus exiguus]|uniref:hypothetical protein n=1 Tax=Corallococcus exiguus TaxID=83462 RepID=UPI0014941705|nr:hypothetical protein [Corallococcus exiguus]NPC70042.1 hypothetical protein [Corallococcus exiguus]